MSSDDESDLTRPSDAGRSRPAAADVVRGEERTPVEPRRRRGIIGTGLRLAATTAVAGTKLTKDVAENGVHVAREVVEGARRGDSPARLAETLLIGVSDSVRDATEAGREIANATPNPVEPIAGAARAVAGQIPRSQLAGLAGRTERDLRQELRRRGQELLRRSTALDDPEEHPAFAHLLGQVAPDEARIVRLLAVDGPQPFIDVVEHNRMSRDSREVSRHVSMIGEEAGCIRPGLAPLYLDNLDRLGIVNLEDFRVGGQEAYDLLEAQPGVVDLEAPAGLLTTHRLLYRSAHLSQLGRYLYEVCFDETADDVTLESLVNPPR